MQRKFLILTFFYCLSNLHILLAQGPLVKTWDRRFGGTDDEWSTCMIATSDGGYLLGGYSISDSSGDKSQPMVGGKDYWIVKLDAFGNKQWDKTFGGLNHDILTSLLEAGDRGFLLGGRSLSGIGGDKTSGNWDVSQNTNDYWVIKIDSAGNKQWDKDFGGTDDDGINAMESSNDGAFFLGGYSNSGISGNKSQGNWGLGDFWLVKIDSMGTMIWDHDFGGSQSDAIYCLRSTTDGGLIVGGTSLSGISGNKTQANWGGSDYWIIKMDSLGNTEWEKDYGGTSVEILNSIQQTMDGGYVLAGISYSGIGGDKTQPSWGLYDYWIVKIDSVGNIEWDKDYGGNDAEEQLGNIIIAPDGGYLMAGTSYSQISGDKKEMNLGAEQVWIVKTDSIGNLVWDKTIFTMGHDENAIISQDSNGCITIATQSNGAPGGYRSQFTWSLSYDYWVVTFCDTGLISSNESSNSWLKATVFPNPVTNDFSIRLPVEYDYGDVTGMSIYNILGEEVHSFGGACFNQNNIRENKINVGSLAPGMYFGICSINNFNFRFKFIKK